MQPGNFMSVVTSRKHYICVPNIYTCPHAYETLTSYVKLYHDYLHTYPIAQMSEIGINFRRCTIGPELGDSGCQGRGFMSAGLETGQGGMQAGQGSVGSLGRRDGGCAN